MENHHFQWENPLDMAIFNCYVGSPEGKPFQVPISFESLRNWEFTWPQRRHPSTIAPVAPPRFQHHGHLVDGTGVGLRQ